MASLREIINASIAHFPFKDMVVRPTRLYFDIERLRKEVRELIALCPFFEAKHQISLRHRPVAPGESRDLLSDGIGAFNELYKKYPHLPPPQEGDYSVLNPLVSNMYLGEVFKTIQTRWPYPMGRYRIVLLKPRTAMPWHSDGELRFHIPIETGEGNFFVTKRGLHSMPTPGRVYKVETLLHHTAINTTRAPRIHLVLCTTIRGYLHQARYFFSPLLKQGLNVPRQELPNPM